MDEQGATSGVSPGGATDGDDTRHLFTLTAPQEAAVQALAAGRTDTAAAEQVGVHRGTVWRWRRYHPAFRAALARRRIELWDAAADRLRSLVPDALDALADELHGEHRLRAAGIILKLAGLDAKRLPGVGEPDPEAIIADDAERRAAADLRDAAARREHQRMGYLLGSDAGAGPAEREAASRKARCDVLADLTVKLAADD